MTPAAPASSSRRESPAGWLTLATTSGPLVASRVLWYGSLAASRRTSPSVNVVVAAMTASSRSAVSVRAAAGHARRGGPRAGCGPSPSVLQPDKGAELPGGATGQPGLVHERAVAHRDQPVCGGRDPRVVGDDDQRLTGLVQALEEPEDPPYPATSPGGSRCSATPRTPWPRRRLAGGERDRRRPGGYPV